jgi:hypothetical protein
MSLLGQLITFAVEIDPDVPVTKWEWVDVKKGDTVQKVASRRGHPEDARRIADANGIRSVRSVFSGHGRKKIKVPGESNIVVRVLAGDSPPHITGGYAKLDIQDRPQRTGLTRFTGYDPVTMDIPIRFDTVAQGGQGVDIEDDIALLERMAGRGAYPGAAVGPPPIVRISTTNARGEIVPLIPANYQWSLANPGAPLWRIQNPIDWDDSVPAGVLRNDAGNRIRQLATVTVQQHTNLRMLQRSVTQRHKTTAR